MGNEQPPLSNQNQEPQLPGSDNDQSDLEKDDLEKDDLEKDDSEEPVSPEVEVDNNENNQDEEDKKENTQDGGDNIEDNTGNVYVILSVVMCILIVCYY